MIFGLSPLVPQLVPLVDDAPIAATGAVDAVERGEEVSDDAIGATKLLLPAVAAAAAAAKKVASEKALAAIVGSIISKLYG